MSQLPTASACSTLIVIQENVVDTVLTIRIDGATRRKLDRLARARRTSRSDIVRQALDQLGMPKPATVEESVHSRIADLVGAAASRRGDLSVSTGRRFAALLKARRQR